MEKLVTFFLLFFLTAGAVLPLFFKCIEVFVFVPSVAEKKLGVCFPEGLVPSAGCRGGWCIFEDSLGTSVERQDQKIFICLVDKYKLLWLLASKFYYLDFWKLILKGSQVRAYVLLKERSCSFEAVLVQSAKLFFSSKWQSSLKEKKFSVRLSPPCSAISLHLTNGLKGLMEFIKAIYLPKQRWCENAMTEWTQNPLMILWGWKVFVLSFNPLMWSFSPFAPGFSTSVPICFTSVCVTLCHYQSKIDFRFLGQQPCLVSWLQKGSMQPKRSWLFTVTTLFFIACLSRAPLQSWWCFRYETLLLFWSSNCAVGWWLVAAGSCGVGHQAEQHGLGRLSFSKVTQHLLGVRVWQSPGGVVHL